MKLKTLRPAMGVFAALLAVYLWAAALAGCSLKGKASEEASPAARSGNGALVVCFSLPGEQQGAGMIDNGNTEVVAEIIARQTGADIFRINPVRNNYYDKSYDELNETARREKEAAARPGYTGNPDLSKYDTVFIGSPVWWNDWPMIVYSFFDKNAEGLKGKTLVPFCTHEGPGLGGLDSALRGACPDSKVKTGLGVRSSDVLRDPGKTERTVRIWLEGLGY